MKTNIFKNILMPNTKIYLLAFALSVGVIAYYNIVIGIIAFLVLLYMWYYNWLIEHDRKKMWQEYIENISEEIDSTWQHALINMPMPLTVIEFDGTITWYNSRFVDVVENRDILNKRIDTLIPTIRLHEIAKATEEGENEKEVFNITYKDKNYKIIRSIVENPAGNGFNILLYWHDITNYENLKILYNDETTLLAYIQVDNYEDVMISAPEEKRPELAAEIDKTIRVWASRINSSITKYDDDKYILIFEHKHLEKLEARKFQILDDVRDIDTHSDFQATLSIGIGVGGKTPTIQDEYAVAALDLAHGRGGDQAVIKKINKIEYYGGKSQTVEKRTKGKSRIMAHAIRQLIDQSSNVIIMGHKSPDMDSFGAAIGIHRMAQIRDKEAYIVLDDRNDGIESILERFKGLEDYSFISNDTALAKATRDSLIVVVDTHRPSFTQCPELLNLSDKIVVIDHHRKMEENIEDAILTYMESYASSASELVTEILQYLIEKKELVKIEAEALLAGISLDTKYFSVRTGVRTFEAASWLRRMGADTANVKTLFRNNMEMIIAKAEIIKTARIIHSKIAIAVCNYEYTNTSILISQVADELLDVKGIEGAFVLGVNEKGEIIISARSLGEINVQVCMEKMGGGGHLTMAGTQVDMPLEEAEKWLLEIINEIIEEGA